MRTLLITHCLVLSARFASLKINNNGTSLGAVLTYIANDRKHLFGTEVDASGGQEAGVPPRESSNIRSSMNL